MAARTDSIDKKYRNYVNVNLSIGLQRSNGFKMAAFRRLRFRKFKFLTTGRIKRLGLAVVP